MIILYWDLSEKCGFERELNWYDHKPNPVCELVREIQTAVGFQDKN